MFCIFGLTEPFNKNECSTKSLQLLDQRIIEMEYLMWYSTDTENLIISGGICHLENNTKKLPIKPKIILT